MPKELFNQPLIESPDQPDDDIRISFGKPGVAGGFNVAWLYLKQLLQGAIDFLLFTPQVTPPAHQEGQMYYDAIEHAFMARNDIADVTLQIGEELWARLVNDTGSTLLNGKVGYVSGVLGIDLTFGLAVGSNKMQSIRALGLFTNDIADTGHGYLTRYGFVRDVDTSMWAPNTALYLSPDTPGELTDIRPSAPNYIVRIGLVVISHATLGVIGVDTLAFNGTDTGVNLEGSLNGTVTQTPQVDISVSGGIIYADVTNEDFPSKELPFLLGGDLAFLDTLTGSGPGGEARVVVPPGASSTAKQTSFIYIYDNAGTPTLAASTAEPVVPYALIAYLTVFDAARTLTDGKPFGYRRHNNTVNRLDGIHDGAFGLSVETINAIRFKLGSNWLSGQDATPTVNDTTIRVALSAGIGSQFRRNSLPAFDGLNYLIYNTIANLITYADSVNLTDITQDATGATLLNPNTFYTIRIFYQLNSNGVGDNIIATRPLGFYTTLPEAISDPLNYTVNVNDTDIEEIVFPLYDLVISRTGGGGATITLGQLTDLRTKLAGGVGGGGAAGGAGTDDKIRITASDTDNDYLNPKLTVTGALKTTVNPGANEVLDFKVHTLYKPDGSAIVAQTDNNGRLGIGRAPTVQLDNYIVTGNIFTRTETGGANSAGYYFKNSLNEWLFYTEGVGGKAQLLDVTGSGIPIIVEPGAATNSLLINSSNNVSSVGNMTATDFILSSDKRLKTEINYENVPSIDGLKPTTYKINGHFRCGFIAQDALSTHRNLVGGSGKEIKGKIDYYSFAESSIIAMLVKEVQELKKQFKNGTR